jgi:HYDIN/CFA65/VesB-like, Ig-like domain/NHL repeat
MVASQIVGRHQRSSGLAGHRWAVLLALLLTSSVVPSNAFCAGVVLKITPGSQTFPAQIFGVFGATSLAKTIKLSNRGKSSITISSIEVDGANPADFAIASNSCPTAPSSLAGGRGCKVAITFSPTGLGVRQATLTIISEALGSPQTVNLRGTGKLGKLVRKPSKLSFGRVKAGTTNARAVTLKNKNPVPLAITSIVATTGFGASQNCVGNLPGQGTDCSISVIFRPPAQSYARDTPINGTLTIVAGAVGGQQTVALSGTAFGTAQPPPPPFSTVKTIVTNSCGAATSYPAGAHGDAVPVAIPTSLCGPVGVALDPSGNVYVANSNNSVTIYAAGASINASPTGIIAGPNTGIHDPVGIAVDTVGNVYVANRAAGYDHPLDTITVYAAGVFGNIAPTKSIEGGNTSLSSGLLRSIAVDHDGNIYASQDIGHVDVFAPGSNGGSAPIRSMIVFCAERAVCQPVGLALDTSGNLYVANNSAYSGKNVAVFAAGGLDSVYPIYIINGPSTGLSNPEGISLDAANNIYVANYDPIALQSTITTYLAGSNGDVSPKTTLAGPATRLNSARGLAIDSAGRMYVADNTGGPGNVGAITIFSPGSDGNASPVDQIASSTALNGSIGVAVSFTGQIYVANSTGGSDGAGSVTIYSAGSNANSAPIAEISGADTGLSTPYGVAVDASGEIYVSNIGNDSITVYPAGSDGDQAPVAMIAGSNTDILSPYGVSLDAGGNIYVLSCADCVPTENLPHNRITVYPRLSNGNVTPSAEISCEYGECGLDFPLAIAVGSDGRIYVASAGRLIPLAAPDSVTVYKVSGSSVIPIAGIYGDQTGLTIPTGITVDGNSNIYVSNALGGPSSLGSVTVYPANSNGNVAPGASIAGPATLLYGPRGIATLGPH